MARKDAKAQKNLAALRLSEKKTRTNNQSSIMARKDAKAQKNLAALRLSEKNTAKKLSNLAA